jgi:hypothetical protein
VVSREGEAAWGTFDDTDIVDDSEVLSEEDITVRDLDRWNRPGEHGATSVEAAKKAQAEIRRTIADLFS